MKQVVANYISARVQSASVIGLGSGTTTEVAIETIGRRIKSEGIEVFGVPTSLRTARVAADNGFKVCDIRTVEQIDWAFDGADEVDPALNLMKGRGAAMLTEKIVANLTSSLFILVTEEKLVSKIGQKFAMPIEVMPGAANLAQRRFVQLGASEVVLRQAQSKYGEVVTDSGNLVFDVKFPVMDDELQSALKLIPGVIETGLFWGLKPQVIVAGKSGLYRLAYEGQQVVKTELSL